MTINQSREAVRGDYREDLMTNGVVGLTIGVAAIGSEALVMSPILEDISVSLETSPGTTGLAVAAYGLALALASPVLGLIGHRMERLALMRWGLTVFVLATAGCGLAQGSGWLICARIACGVAAGAYLPACYAFVGDAIPYERRAKVMGRIMFGWSLSLVIGVPLGGFIGQFLGWRMSFFAVATVGLVALLFISRLESVAKDATKIVSAATARQWPLPPSVWAIFGVTFFNMLGFYSVYTYFGTAVRHAQDIGSAGAAGYTLCYGLGLAFSTLRGDILDRIGKVRLLGLALLLLSPLFAVQAATFRNPVILVPIMLVWGVLQGAVLTGIATVLTHQAGAVKGMATALNSSLTYLAVASGATLGGPIIDGEFGFAGICLVASVASAVSWVSLQAAKISA